MTPTRDQREAFEHMFKGNNSHVLELKSYLKSLEEQKVNEAIGSIENENQSAAALGALKTLRDLSTILFK